MAGAIDEQFVLLRDGDVFDGALDGEQVGEDLAAGERGEGERADELLRGRGHHDLHLVALLHQQARQFRGFVSRDAAADAEDDVHTGLENGFGQRIVMAVGQRSGEVVLHQAAAHFFHGDDGGLLGRRRQHRTRAALQLPGALGGDDDEAVGALLRIVGKGAVRVIAGCFVSAIRRYLLNLKCFQNRPDLVFHSGSAGPARREQSRSKWRRLPPDPD